MLKRVVLAFAVLGLAAIAVARVEASVLENGKVNVSQGNRVPGRLVIQLANGFMPFGNKMQSNGATMGIPEVDAINIKYGMSDYYPMYPRGFASTKSVPVGESPMDRWHVLYFSESADLDKIKAEYEALPQVEKVEFDYYAYIMRTPNDTQYPLMYQFNQANDRDMDGPEAWDVTVGNPDVVLADCDTGTLWSHEDLVDNIWVNPGEDLDGDHVVMDPSDMNGIDDDGNGYIDDLIGWDFVSGVGSVWPGEDGSVQDNDPKDFNGHGTHTSGTIASKTNNGVGVSGVAGGFGGSEPGCKLMCLRQGWSFSDGGVENGQTIMSIVAQAFTYAYRNGAVAINYSFGSSAGGGIEAATDSAVANQVVISASAGNDGGAVTGYLQTRTDVLCVASTTSSDAKSSFSNFGPEVDIAAPGSSIRSTYSSHYSPGYAILSGTSMAAPQVVGQVGLIRSLNPNLTRQEVFDIIINTTDNIGVPNIGSGRINLRNSLSNLASTNFAADPVVGPAPLTVQFADSSLTTPTGWMWHFGDGDSSALQNPSHVYNAGLYNVTLRTETAIGTGLKTKINYVAALAETLLTADSVGDLGQNIALDIWATNNQPLKEIILPLSATNIPLTATFDSMVTTGCRTNYFEYQQLVFDNRANGAGCLRMRSDNNSDGLPAPLPAGSGPIARLWFKMKPNASAANPIVIDTATLGSSHYKLRFYSPVVDFVPVFAAGSLSVCVLPADFNFDGFHDITDVVQEIAVVFRAGALPNPPEAADATCDGIYDVTDVVKVIGFAFRNVSASCCQ